MMNIIYFSRADVNYSVDCIDKGNTEYVAEFVQEQTGLAFKCSGSTVKNTQKWIYDLCRQQKCGEMVIFMNIQAILVANITGFVLLLILYISRAITRIKSDTEEKAIDALMMLTLIACVVQSLTFVVDGLPGMVARYTIILGNTYLYYSNVIGPFLFCMYVDLNLYHDRARIRRIYRKLSIPVSALILSLILNLFFGFYFCVDENNVYHRQPMNSIIYIYLMLCAVYSLVLYFKHKCTAREASFFPIYMYLTPMVVCILLQKIFYGLSLMTLGDAIGIVALYMSLQNEKTYKDGLTGLYNRLYLTHELFVIKNAPNAEYYGIMIDMNYFKKINDTYGHAAGDQALVDMASIMKKRFSGLGKCFRYAGDEFVVLVKSDNEAEILEMENALSADVEAFNERENRPYKLSFSKGYGKFEKETDDDESFLRKIDDAMYIDKRDSHDSKATNGIENHNSTSSSKTE